MHDIMVQRIYDDTATNGARRILVDRLWPRGISKERAHLDLWLKEIAPSTELRKEFHGDALTWPAFRERYIAEVHASGVPFEELLDAAKAGPIVLLYGSHDTQHNHAVILRDLLRDRLGDSSG